MSKADVARNVLELSTMLCISVEEAWEKHTDESTKKIFDLEDIKKEIEKLR